jgi:hypothetical protein
MMGVPRLLGQALAYAAFALAIGVFSSAPAYRHLPEDAATIKLSLRHAGKLVSACRDRTPEEMQNLPPNMRAPQVCPRERSPLTLELDIDGSRVLSEVLPARGLHGDGRASVYRRLTVPAGAVEVSVRLKDDVNAEGFQYQSTRAVTLEPAEVLVIDFDEQRGVFEIL